MLLKSESKIIGQGITGSEGSVAAKWMRVYGTNLVAGVTPGKGGQDLDGVPIFNTVSEVVEKLGAIDASVLYVPPIHVKKAAIEAIESGVKLLLIVTEKVPVSDSAYLYAFAKERGSQIIGPASVGLINPKLKLKLGSIGGGDPDRVFIEGSVAVLSKSGGMTSEIGLLLKNNDSGVSWAVGIGGERIIGSDYADLLLKLEEDEETRCSVIFGELGGTYEERVAELVSAKQIKKPVIAFIAGEFTLTLPSNVQFGHAGAIIEGDRGRPDSKRRILREAGVRVAEEFDDIAKLVKEVLNGQDR